MRKDRNIEELYSRFRAEMDNIELPSESQLTEMLERYEAQGSRCAPVVPLSRRQRPLRYVAAAAVAALLAVFGWMAWPKQQAMSPQTAAIGADSTTEVRPYFDTVVTALPQPVEQENAVRVAVVQHSDSSVAPRAIAPAVTDTLPLHTRPEAPQQFIAEQDETTPPQPEKQQADSTRAPEEPARGMDEYPDRPTIEETENLIKEENNRRALRNRKKQMRRETRKHGFIEKQKEPKESRNVIIHDPPRQPMLHHIMGSNGQIQVLYY